MRHELLNPLQEPRWNDAVAMRSDATVFHSAQWARVISESYGYRPQYALFESERGIVGMIPTMEVSSLWTGRRGVCLPFSDECVPLIAEGVSPSDLVDPIRKLGMARRWDYLELRGGQFQALATPTNQFVVHRLRLEASEELQIARLRDSTRRNIDKAAKQGVEVQHLKSIEAVESFYTLHCRTRRRHGLPPQPLRFFHLIYKHLIEQGLGFVSLARFSGQWIAGAVFLHFGSHAVYKFGASEPAFQQLRANNLVMWRAICRMRESQIAELSFGRSDRDDEGLLQFKRGWGGSESELPYYRIGLRRQSPQLNWEGGTRAGGVSQQIVRRLPIGLLRLMGGVIYRHLG